MWQAFLSLLLQSCCSFYFIERSVMFDIEERSLTSISHPVLTYNIILTGTSITYVCNDGRFDRYRVVVPAVGALRHNRADVTSVGGIAPRRVQAAALEHMALVELGLPVDNRRRYLGAQVGADRKLQTTTYTAGDIILR